MALAELEGLKAELLKARQEAKQQKAAAAKAGKDLTAKKVAREKEQGGSWRLRRAKGRISQA